MNNSTCCCCSLQLQGGRKSNTLDPINLTGIPTTLTHTIAAKKVGIESLGAAVVLVVVVVDQLYDDDGHEAPFAPRFFSKAGGMGGSARRVKLLKLKMKCEVTLGLLP